MPDEDPQKNKKAQRKRKKRERAKRDILDATRTVILRDGIDAVTIQSLADELGLSKGALYYYFSSKHDLIDAFITELFDEMYAPMKQAVDDAPDGFSAIEALMRTMLKQGEESLDGFRALYVAPQLYQLTSPSVLEYINEHMRRLYAVMEAKLEADGFDEPDPRRAAVLAWASTFGLVSLMSLFDASDTASLHPFEELLGDLIGIFERGLAANRPLSSPAGHRER